jgi:hypothetical protein
MKIFQQLDYIEKSADTVPIETHEFMDIIKHLVREKKDLQERLNIMEEILHSMLPVIGKDNNDKENK